jgi:hypothetical protein
MNTAHHRENQGRCAGLQSLLLAFPRECPNVRIDFVPTSVHLWTGK